MDDSQIPSEFAGEYEVVDDGNWGPEPGVRHRGDEKLPSLNRFVHYHLVRSMTTCDEGELCGICREEMSDAVVLPCSHKLDALCIFEWLQTSFTWPICRRRLFTDYIYPRQALSERKFRSRRRLFLLVNDEEKSRQAVGRIMDAVPGLSETDARYALRRAYESTAKPVAATGSTMCLLVHEELRPHLAAMVEALTVAWPDDLEEDRVLQLRHIAKTVDEMLQLEWKDQEGDTMTLLSEEWFYEATWARVPWLLNPATGEVDGEWRQDWYSGEPLLTRDIFNATEDGRPTTPFFQWMLWMLFSHVLSMSTAM